MSRHSIYTSPQGKDLLLRHYETYVRSLPGEVESRYVTTRFGQTHLLQLGPPEGKPLIILQGGNCINPMTLSWFSPLFQHYRIYAPDTIGHPGYSDENRLSGKDGSLAFWLSDVMVSLSLPKCALIGASFGGGIILRLAAHLPDKIACAVLVSPAGIRLGSKIKMVKQILIPLIKYKLGRANRNLQKIADAMSMGTMKEIDKTIIGDIFTHVKLEQDMPKLCDPAELSNYRAPTMLIAGKKDLFFPADPVLKRAREIIPYLTAARLFEMGHFPSEIMQNRISQEIHAFLEAYYEVGRRKDDE